MKAATDSSVRAAHTQEFQSTPPVKAATSLLYAPVEDACISIHAAREGGDAARMPKVRNDDISIHAAREGGDGRVRGSVLRRGISIHAAREGGDAVKIAA